MGSDTEKSVVKLGGNCGAVGHQSEVAREGGQEVARYPCLINVRQWLQHRARTVVARLHYYSSTCAK